MVLAKYLRISKKDKNSEESNSICNQRLLLNQYIEKDNQLKQADIIEYIDDGYSGTNFCRPAIQTLLQEVKAKKVNGIIVKDFSRFGRNYLEVGEYLTKFFPMYPVRFISVNDQFDSNQIDNKSEEMGTIFKTVFHELNSRDLSVKVHSAKKQKSKKGYYIGGIGIFGYQKNPEQPGQLIIDDKAAEIVKLIFDYALEGFSMTEIARKLNEKEILTPMLYRKKYQGINFTSRCIQKEKNYWTKTRVSKIINEERYTGKLISGNVRTSCIGKRNAKTLPKKDWIVVENAFPPIISDKTFQKLKMQKTTPVSHHTIAAKNNYPLKGMVRCGGCRHLLRRKNSKNSYYYCSMKEVLVENSCFLGKINQEALTKAVCQILQKYLLLLAEPNIKNTAKEIEEEIEKIKLQKRRNYERFCEGHFTKDRFLENQKIYTEKLENLMHKEENHTNWNIENQLLERIIDSIYIYTTEEIKIVFRLQNFLEPF